MRRLSMLAAALFVTACAVINGVATDGLTRCAADEVCDGLSTEEVFCDRGSTCSASCPDGRCTQTCWEADCDFSCAGGDCDQECVGGQCTLSCDGEDCDQECVQGASCTLAPCEDCDCSGPDCPLLQDSNNPDPPAGDCLSGSCQQTCAANDACDLECVGGDCEQRCAGTCTMKCEGAGCSQVCEAGATCDMGCRGGACTQQCEGSCTADCAGGGCRCLGSGCR